MFTKYFRNKEGMALALVLMVFAVVMIIATATLTISLSETRQSVSTQKYVENYYYARSATDTVSTDLINMIDQLRMEGQNLQANPSPSAVDLANYAASKAEIQQILSGGNIIVSGIGKKDIISKLISTATAGGVVVEIESSYANEGRSSKARVSLGTVSTTPIAINTNGTAAAIYSWDDMYFGQTPVIVDGNIKYGKSLKIKNNPAETKDAVVLPTDSIVVPATATKNPTIKIISSTKNITSANNGMHGKVDFSNNTTLTVDTSVGDVYLGFNQLIFGQSSSIKVVGNGNLYIYLFESDDIKLLSAGNSFEIYNAVITDKTPRTYIIAKPIDTSEPYCTVDVGNSERMYAFFYLPGTKFISGNTAESKQDFVGAIWAQQIQIDNNFHLKYVKPNNTLPMVDGSGTVTVNEEYFEVKGFDLDTVNVKRLWIK